jgi:hypothetical protein
MRDSGELESVTGNSPRVVIPPSPLAFSRSQEPLQITRLTRMQANTPSLPKRFFPHNSTTQTKLSYRAQKHPPLTRPPTELRTTAQNQSPSSSVTNQNSVPAHTTRRRWTLTLSLSLSLSHTHTAASSNSPQSSQLVYSSQQQVVRTPSPSALFGDKGVRSQGLREVSECGRRARRAPQTEEEVCERATGSTKRRRRRLGAAGRAQEGRKTTANRTVSQHQTAR